jgi:hypothetical protein
MRWLVLATATVALAGCSSVKTLSFPPPPSTVAPPTTVASVASNLGSTQLAGVDGVTTTTAPVVGPGAATLTGTVFGPAGPVAGATVQAERLVGDAAASTEATTASDGSWTITGVLGGRYRVRAWQAPTLDLTTPQILWLGGTDTQPLTLQLTSYAGTQVTSALAPTTPVLGQPANLVVQILNPTVGADGVVHPDPVVGASVVLTASPDWVVSGPPSPLTSSTGRVLFSLSCQVVGLAPLSVSVGGSPDQPLASPSCEAPPTTTTSTTSTTSPFGFFPPATSGSGATTTTNSSVP